MLRHRNLQSRLIRPAFALALAGAGAAVLPSPAAHANGRPPATNGVVFRPGDNESIYIRTTFGLLVSRDAGCSFRWVCEANIGYGGTYDPKYAIAADGALFATTFDGLRVSRDGGCSFTTATAELPANAPGRIAETWVDALDIGPTGEVWVATADSAKPNDIYRSTDNGVTFAARGMQSPMILWKSLAVARSDAMRVYAAGYQVSPSPVAHLVTTADGGQSWTPSALTGVQVGSVPLLEVAAIDPAKPQIVYVVSAGSNGAEGARLYRSTDGAVTFTPVLMTSQPIANVVIRDATTVLVASGDGLFRSTDGGATFGPASTSPHLTCLGKRPDGALIGCAPNWDPDFMAVGRSDDASQWTKLFRFIEMAGPLSCPAGTPGHDVCEQELWPGIRSQFGATGSACGAPPVDGPPEKPEAPGCCDTGARSPLGFALLTALTAFLLGRRRPRR
jgi:hypothetical protein